MRNCMCVSYNFLDHHSRVASTDPRIVLKDTSCKYMLVAAEY